jgi:hypothetical protein
MMAWLAVGLEIVLFTLLNFELLSASTYLFQVPSLISSGILLKDVFSNYGFSVSPLALLEVAWFIVAIIAFSRLVIRTTRRIASQ